MNNRCMVDDSSLTNYRLMVIGTMIVVIAMVVRITEQRMSRNRDNLNLWIRLLNNNLLCWLSVDLLRSIITAKETDSHQSGKNCNLHFNSEHKIAQQLFRLLGRLLKEDEAI